MNPTKDIPSEMWKEIMKSIKIDSLSCLGNLLLVSKTFYEDVFKCCDFTPVQTAILKRFANKGGARQLKLMLENPSIDPSTDHNVAIREASSSGQLEVVKILLQDPRVDPADKNSICWACKNGHYEIVKLLLEDKRVDPSADNDIAFRLACRRGHVEITKLLLKDPRVDPSSNNNNGIHSACMVGNLEVVELLLNDPRVDPSSNQNGSIIVASTYGHTEVVKLLLKDPRVNPADRSNNALHVARKNDHQEVIKLLLSDSRKVPRLCSTSSDRNFLMEKGKKISLDLIILEATIYKIPPNEFLLDSLLGKKSLDSYCRIRINDKVYMTNMVENESNPIFNEDCSFLCRDSAMCRVELYQGSFETKSILIGEEWVMLKNLESGTNDLWLNLKLNNETTAKLHLLICRFRRNEEGLLNHYGNFILKTIPLRLQSGDIILFNTNLLFGSVTRLVTWNQWDHVAMVIETPKHKLKLVEAIPDGVCIFGINSRLKYYHEISTMAIRRLELNRNDEMVKGLYEFAMEIKGRPYKQWNNVMEFVKALNYQNNNENLTSIFCSELIAAAYKRVELVSEKLISNNILPRDFDENYQNGNGFQLKQGKLGKMKIIYQKEKLINLITSSQPINQLTELP